jgi:hypothetical protein
LADITSAWKLTVTKTHDIEIASWSDRTLKLLMAKSDENSCSAGEKWWWFWIRNSNEVRYLPKLRSLAVRSYQNLTVPLLPKELVPLLNECRTANEVCKRNNF